MAQPLPDQRPGERRAGQDRRIAVIPFPVERRRAADRRSGADRRGASLRTSDHLRGALAHLMSAAEDATLDDEVLRRLDNVLVRLWALLEEIEPRRP
jgi:hypothetical protein